MAHVDSKVALQDGSKSVVALLLAATPVYFYSLQARTKFGLDALHLGLIQIVLLLVLGQLSSLSSRTVGFLTRSTSQKENQATTATDSQATNGSAAPVSTKRHAKTKAARRKRKARAKASGASNASAGGNNALYPAAMCDKVVRNFLAATEPEYAKLLPAPASDEDTKGAPESMPLSDWKELYKEDNLVVRQHPTANKLFALQAQFPSVPVRKLFEVLTTIDKRKEYDGMTQDTKEIDRFELVADAPQGGKREIKGAAVWLAMKGMGPIKAKDMVLLSIAGRLPVPAEPTSADDGGGNKDNTEGEGESTPDTKQKIRMYCATSSFDHPDYPPQSGFNRMQMGVTGFLIEEDGNGGSNIVQVTDLSGLGSWVPGAVIRTVTQTMLPKTLYKLGKVAAAFDLEQSRYSVDGDDWIPPLLGYSDPNLKPSGANGAADVGDDDESTLVSDSEAEDDDSELDDEEDDDEDELDASAHALSPSSSRALHNLVSQLRAVTSRLSALESQATPSSKDGTGKKWYTSLIPGYEQGVMGGSTAAGAGGSLLWTTVGGAAGAAIAMAALRAWERKRA